MRHTQRGIAHFARLFSKDGAQQPLFRSKLGLALRGNLAHQNITGTHFGPDLDDAVRIQIFQNIIADIGNFTRDDFLAKFRIPRFMRIFFNMN